MNRHLLLFVMAIAWLMLGNPSHAAEPAAMDFPFPHSLDSYNEAHLQGILEIIIHCIQGEPFNLVATLIFFAAIIHTFMTSTFMTLSHKWHHEHAEKVKRGGARRHSVNFRAELFHFLGEVEVVFDLTRAVALWSQSPHYPAGQSILKRHVDDAISPLGLLRAALMPTMIVWLCFTLLGRSCTPCLSYKSGHRRPILIALELSGARLAS